MVFKKTIHDPSILAWDNTCTSKEEKMMMLTDNLIKATLGWFLGWQIFLKRFWYSRSVKKKKEKIIIMSFFLFEHRWICPPFAILPSSLKLAQWSLYVQWINWAWPNRGVAGKLAKNLLLSYQCNSGVSSSAVTKTYFPQNSICTFIRFKWMQLCLNWPSLLKIPPNVW